MPLRPFNTSQQTLFAASDDANLPGPWQQGIATFYGGQPDGKVRMCNIRLYFGRPGSHCSSGLPRFCASAAACDAVEHAISCMLLMRSMQQSDHAGTIPLKTRNRQSKDMAVKLSGC